MRYNKKIVLQIKEKQENELGETFNYVDKKIVPCRKILMDTDGQEKFSQMGYSEVQYYFEIPYKVRVEISKMRIKEIIGDKIVQYEVVNPPETRGLYNKTTRFYVKRVNELSDKDGS